MIEKHYIIERHRADSLLELILEHTRSHRADDIGKVFRTMLAELHNDGTIDVLEPARTIANSSISQHDFFSIMHVYCDLIPALEAGVPEMLSTVKALTSRAGDDMASGVPNGAFRTWAEHGDRARATLAALDPEDSNDAAYIFLGMQALAHNDPDAALAQAIIYLAGLADPARSAAAKAIGTFALETPQALNSAANALVAASTSADDRSLGHILTAICEIARAHPDMEASAVALIENSMPQVGDHALHQLSFELMFHGEELSPSIVASLTAILQKVSIVHRGTLQNIDAAGGKLVSHGRLDEALALITPLIAEHNELSSLEALDSFSYTLRQLAPDKLTEVIVSWLLSLHPNLGQAALALVSNHHGDTPLILEVNSATLGLADADKILLAHRAIGYLFIHPITAASLVIGLAPSVSEDSRKVIAEIIFDPLLINYSGTPADWLREHARAVSEPTQPIIEELLARLDAYIEGLRRVGRIKELRPSERERLIESHRRLETMRQSHKQAEKRSVLMSIVSRSVILYGNRSISYFDRGNGQKQRSEMKLHSFSHIIESPRLDILEPFELDYTLRVFRSMRRTK